MNREALIEIIKAELEQQHLNGRILGTVLATQKPNEIGIEEGCIDIAAIADAILTAANHQRRIVAPAPTLELLEDAGLIKDITPKKENR